VSRGGWIPAILLLLFFAQAVSSIPLKAPTFDEEFHIARAYAYVRTGDLRMQQNHPPLVSVLAGVPLLTMPELTAPEEIPHWDDAYLFYFADHLFWHLGHDVDKMLFLARFPIILLGTLLGAFVYRWARETYGTEAGFLAAGLYAFAPNLLAHTRLVTTDLAVTAWGFIALYAFRRYLRRPTGYRICLTGLALGLALAAKLSALLVIPVMGLLLLLTRLRDSQPSTAGTPGVKRVGPLRDGAVILLIAGLVVWAFYRFEMRAWPGSTLLLPATTYLLNVRTLIGHAGRGHGAFLMGRVSMHGWWYYFPVAFLLKTPLLTLNLLGWAVWDAVRQVRWRTGLRRRTWRTEIALLLFPTAYFGFALASSLNIGYRYILPVVPFVIVYAAGAVAAKPAAAQAAGAKATGPLLPRWTWLRRYVLPALMALYAGVSLWLHPHYLAYFNLLAGGPGGGYRYLVDSNLDWGQDLKLLQIYLEAQGVDEVRLGYFGTADPAYYGIQYRSLFAPDSSGLADDFSPFNPAPGWYAVSATVLQGPFSSEPDLFDWFRRHEPVAKIGYSIFVYRVEPDPDPVRWLGVCYTPEPLMRDGEISRRFGRDDLRRVGFDCAQTWVYPAGSRPGWYLVPAANPSLADNDLLAGQLMEEAQVVYRERGLRDMPGYTVYRWGGGTSLEALSLVEQAWASAALAPVGTDPVVALSVPVDLGGQVSFMGYSLSSDRIAPGGEILLTTAWQVTAQPEDPPLSMFAHVVGPTGALSVGDGLGYPAIQWGPGDAFVQRNRLLIPAEVAPGRYWVQVGFYSLSTGERLPTADVEGSVADRLLLAPVEIYE